MPWMRDGTGLRYEGEPHYDAEVVRRLIAQLRLAPNKPQSICSQLEELLRTRSASKNLVWYLSKWCDWNHSSSDIAKRIAFELFNGHVCRRLLDSHNHPMPDQATAEADYQQWLTRVVGDATAGKPDPPPQPLVLHSSPPTKYDIYSFIQGRGYRFPEWLITDYLLSLATKPLVLLCGISGTGKTKLAQLVAEYVSSELAEANAAPTELEVDDDSDSGLSIPEEIDPDSAAAHIAFISVRPDWTDNRSLLGYLNPLTAQYSPTELLRLLLRAHDNPDEPHFAILDEMNLAKVEYYFSDFLSAMESGTEMVLHDSSDEVTVELDGTLVTVPRRLQIPRNVFFTGTVNVDETTYMFSPKVLDRANVIEFHDVDLRSYAAGAAADDDDFRLPQGADLAALLKHPGGAYEWARPSDFAGLSASATDRLREIHDLLAKHNLHFGYRVANEVARFMNLVAKHVGPGVEAEALDLQLLQKVLPKLAGNAARLEQPLLELYADIAQAKYPAEPDAACDLPRTAAKIGRMLKALRDVGFASFVE